MGVPLLVIANKAIDQNCENIEQINGLPTAEQVSTSFLKYLYIINCIKYNIFVYLVK